jgi:Fe-S-cluster containining protein
VSSLNNYYRLLAKIDERCNEIYAAYQQHIVCQKGCCTCCRLMSVFAVEAAAVSLALSRLPHETLLRLRQNADTHPDSEICPLLEKGACAVYESRPVICRTHGLPILVLQNGRHEADFCPLNFQNLSSFPSQAMIDIEKLNRMLFAINGVFIAEFPEITQERFGIYDLLFKPLRCY